jgi:hypothetical protein
MLVVVVVLPALRRSSAPPVEPVFLSVCLLRPSAGQRSLFFALPKKSNQKKGASLGGQQRGC